MRTELHGSAMINKTMMVEKHKQKIETPTRQTITDLDKGVVYL